MNFLEYFNQDIFLKSLILGIFASLGLGILGVFVVLKKSIFISLAISELAVLGFVLGIMFGINPYLSMIFIVFLGLMIFSFYKEEKSLSEESLVGIIYVVAFSLSVLFLSKTSFLQTHILDTLSGNILIATTTDLIFSFFVCLVSILFFILFKRQLFFIYSDRESSYAFGINYKVLNFIFFFIVGLNFIFFLRSIGLMLSFGYLVIPTSLVLVSSTNIKKLV
ncbi:MAG: metal ABC transporter permease, partial [Endomicrobiia bacterium]